MLLNIFKETTLFPSLLSLCDFHDKSSEIMSRKSLTVFWSSWVNFLLYCFLFTTEISLLGKRLTCGIRHCIRRKQGATQRQVRGFFVVFILDCQTHSSHSKKNSASSSSWVAHTSDTSSKYALFYKLWCMKFLWWSIQTYTRQGKMLIRVETLINQHLKGGLP